MFAAAYRRLMVSAIAAGMLATARAAETDSSRPLPAARHADYLVHVWRSEDGLPQNTVNCLAQTPDGYLWVGTRNGGLARFDGVRFVTFTPQTTPELRDVEVENLSVDTQGVLWIAAGNESLSVFTGKHFRLVREPNAQPRWHPLHSGAEDEGSVFFPTHQPVLFRVPRNGAINAATRFALDPPPQRIPVRFLQGRDGGIWYVARSGNPVRLQVATNGTGATTVLNLGKPVQAMLRDSKGDIWVASGNRIGILTGGVFQDCTPTNGPPPKEIRNLAISANGALWVWEGERLRWLQSGQWGVTAKDFQPVTRGENLIFHADSQGGLWVINYGTGLWHVRPDGTATLLTKADGLPSTLINCWLEDREGNIWIGTKEGGIARIRRSWFHIYGVADGIPGDVAQSVCQDARGNMWVGTATGGLARKDGEIFVTIPLPEDSEKPIESVTVFPDATNGIWVGTVHGSVLRYANGELTRPFPRNQIRDRLVDAVMQDSLGRVWFGNGAGASYWHEGSVTTFGRQRGFVEQLGVRAIAEGPPGTLWFGTEPGDVWQFENGKLTQHRPPADWANARVSALLPDADGRVWVGTLGGGLWQIEKGRFRRITSQHGLPGNSITQLLEDQAGNLWGGTEAGIFRAAKAELNEVAAGRRHQIACSVYGNFSGLPPQAYSGWYQPACWRSRDGNLWFTTVKGLVTVDPRVVKVNQRPPPVVIEEMRVDGWPRDISPPVEKGRPGDREKENSKPLEIKPGRHYVEFRFTGLNFTAPDKVRFRWRLEGVENEWREGVNQRVIGYGPLLPGHYRFRVLAANSDGIWNEQGDALGFIVLPYFWETWWFKAGLILASFVALALAVTLTLRRKHRLEMQNLEHKNATERERTRIAQDLHDDLGTSLTQIGMLSSLVSRENTPSAEIKELTGQIRATARTMVTALNEIVWAVNPKNDSLNELLGYFGYFAEEFFRGSAIRCRLDIPDELPELALTAEIRHGLFLAFKEALNNAAKHSAATEVQVLARWRAPELALTVTDNGQGFDPARPAGQAGNGLTNMKQRLDKLGGRCEIETRRPGGTTVIFRLTVN